MKKELIFLLLVGIVAIIATGSVSAATGDKYVNGTGGLDTNTGDSWLTAYQTIQKGLDNVADGGTINIAPGTYTGTGNTQLDVKTSEVTIAGSGQDKTIIDGQNTNQILYIESDENVTVQDLTMRNGNSASFGGAIESEGGDELIVKNVIFENNHADEGGAIMTTTGTTTITGSTFKGNTARAGGAMLSQCNAEIIDCTFEKNIATAWAGAIWNNINVGDVLTITNSKFIENKAELSGGAIMTTSGTTTITGSTFTGNTAEDGGGIFGTATITGSTFEKNTANDDGGAIYNTGSATITNSIFKENKASNNGGAIYNEGTLTAIGCNFYGNIADDWGGAICNYKEQGGGSILALNDISYDVSVKYSRFVGNTVSNNPQDIHMEGGTLNAKLNWWGSNTGPAAGRITGINGNLPSSTYDPWLMLNIKADPTTIYTGGTSTITANVYKDSAGGDHSADAAQFFSGPEITFTTNLGKIGSDSITVPWVLGKAIRPLVANEGPGTAHVTATDGQLVSTDVTILQAPAVNAATSTEGTVGMQETGLPIAGLILAVLMLFSGLIVSKR